MFRTMNLQWLAAILVQGILVGILCAKRMWRRFPLFFSYIVTGFLFSVALYIIYLLAFRLRFLRLIYPNVYWVNEGLAVLLGIAVVYEIFKHLFSPYPGLRKLATQVFQVSIALLVLLGCIVAYAQPLGERNHIQAALMLVEQASRILEIGLLLFLFLFASAFGLHWRQYAFGIALGLGIFVAVELVGITMRVQFGVTANSIFNTVRMIAFNLSLVIWTTYLLAPELATSPAEMPKRAQLEQWNNAIMELIYQ